MTKEMRRSARTATDNTLMAILNVRDREKGQDLIISISAVAASFAVIAMRERFMPYLELVNSEICLGTPEAAACRFSLAADRDLFV